MRFRPYGKVKWEIGLENNANGVKTDYGGVVYYFAQRWAEAMEDAIAKGQQIADCAASIEGKIDKQLGRYGLTGFQYGCVVGILAACWYHGEELRRWHNLKIQIQNEGERANLKPGRVLNPALLSIGK